MNASPAAIAQGGDVTLAWAGITDPEPTDWIGLYRVGDPDYCFLDWIYVSGTEMPTVAAPSGSAGFTMLVGPGHYQFRLFSHGGWNRLAISDFVEVTPL